MLEAVARAVLGGDRGDLRAHLDKPHPVQDTRRPAFAASASLESAVSPFVDPPIGPPSMKLSNGLGGFSDDGRTYAIVLVGDQETPLPWVNVIANAHFGTIVTASGSATTWSENSRENRLTSFANDPVVDPTAEALFVRDDESGDAWSPTPGPMARHPLSGQFVIRHSAGTTQFLRVTRGIRHELDVFVDVDDPVKFSLLTLTNDSGTRANAERLLLTTTGCWVRRGTARPDRLRRPTTRRAGRFWRAIPTATSSHRASRSRTRA